MFLIFLLLLPVACKSNTNCSNYAEPYPITPSNHWLTSLPPSTTIRDHTSNTILLNDVETIVSWGGLNTPTTTTASVSSDVNLYNILDSSIIPTMVMEDFPAPRFGHSSFTWLNSIFFVGGFTVDYTMDIWRADFPGFTVSTNATLRPGERAKSLNEDEHTRDESREMATIRLYYAQTPSARSAV